MGLKITQLRLHLPGANGLIDDGQIWANERALKLTYESNLENITTIAWPWDGHNWTYSITETRYITVTS